MTKASIEFQGLEPLALADQIAGLWEQWDSGRKTWRDRVAEVIQYVFATSTRETTNSKNPWSHSTVVPKLTQIHDNLGANYCTALFGAREFFTFDPADTAAANIAKRKAVVNYLATKHTYSGFKQTMKRLLDDWVQTGNAFGRLDYVREKEMIDGTEVVVYEGPKLTRISPYDIAFDPTVAEFKDSPKIIRSMITRGELFRRAEGPEGEDFDKEELQRVMSFYRVLSGLNAEQINKNVQRRMDGFSDPASYFASGKVELLDFVGDIYDCVTGQLHKSRLITIVDRRYILRNRSLEDLQGFGKIYHKGWRRRPDNLWAQGPLDNLIGMQYMINHLENARGDGFDQMLSPDRVHIGQVEIEKDGPTTNYYVDDAQGDVKNLLPDATVLSADNKIQLYEAMMEAYAGAPREAMGIRSPGEKTAFEVQRLENAAGRMFQVKIEEFEEMVEDILDGELELSVANLNATDVAKVVDDDFGVAEFLQITKDDLRVKGKLKALGASHYAKRAQLVQELQGFSTILAGDPAMAVHFPGKARAKAWNDAMGFDKLELFKPFGQIAENVELAQAQQAANIMMSRSQAASETLQQEQTDIATGEV